MRKLLLALALLLALSFVLVNRQNLTDFLTTLQHAQPVWIGLALLVQIAWMLNVAAQHRAAYRVLGLERKIRELLPLVLTSIFLNITAPTGGVSGMAAFLADGRRRGLSAAKVTIAGVLYILFDYIAFCAVLAITLIILFRRNTLTAASLVPSVIMFCAAIGLGAVVLLGMRSAHALEHVLVRLTRAVNWVVRPLKPEYLSEAAARRFAADAGEGLASLRQQPRGSWLFPIALALSSKALLITIFFLMFLAFNQPFSIGTVVAGFSIGFLFQIVSPTPVGIGVVESAMVIALRTFGIPVGTAFAITIVYRGLTIWLPLLYGFIAFQLSVRPAK